jgi:hypothetical protein
MVTPDWRSGDMSAFDPKRRLNYATLISATSWFEEFHTKFAQQRSVCIDQIPTEFGEYPRRDEQRQILPPTPHIEANATDATAQSLAR